MSPIITIRWVGLYLYIISDSSSSISKYWSFCPPFLAGRYEFTMISGSGVFISIILFYSTFILTPPSSSGCIILSWMSFHIIATPP